MRSYMIILTIEMVFPALDISVKPYAKYFYVPDLIKPSPQPYRIIPIL